MNLENALIIPKRSKYDLDKHAYRCTHNDLIELYEHEGIDPGRIIDSHERQQLALSKLEAYFEPHHFIQRDQLTLERTQQASIVFSLGGDNHFNYISHYVEHTPVVGINSDPQASTGVLLNYSSEDVDDLIKRLESGNFETEQWTRLEATINGKKIMSATGDYFVGEKESRYMSRHILSFNNSEVEQKSSGLLIATGTGSTGWYNSACRYSHEDGNRFARSENEARFLLREPYLGRGSTVQLAEGTLKLGDELTVSSLNDSAGIVSPDSIEEYLFNRGAVLKIKISETPLRVLR